MTRRRHLCAIAGLTVLAAVGLAGCGPVPVEQAERQCLDTADRATGPRGKVGIGMSTDGHRTRVGTGLSFEISSDYVMGRDPADAFNRCVLNRSGRMPTRPLYEQPGWRGQGAR
ncbi:hypothetical protein [Paracoccus pacificus]|uniref:Lipoprotein n=1 Tax=Paracoccus pacificus TaxID=1463598 RepID=A0ABW4R6Z6_9RHOB